MKLTFKRNNLILFIVLFSMILPTINLFNFEIPVVYLLTPIGILAFIFVLFGWIKIPSIIKPLTALWIMILAQIIFAAFYSTIDKLGSFIFPTDIVQYVVRFVFLISFIILAYKGKVDKDKFIKYFLVVLTFGMIIGILQWIPWPGREFFIGLYPYKDGTVQLGQLSRGQLYRIRMHGFSQHATANGGVASFAFAYAYSVRRYYGKYKILTLSLLILSIINILAGQTRAGMLAVALSVILFYFINIKYEKRGLKSTAYFAGVITVFGSVVINLYNMGNVFIVRTFDRWVKLIETGGGARATTQPQYFFSMMEGMDYILGLSKSIINRSAISYGVEIEPVNILVTYGITGVVLQYSLIAVLLIYFYKKISKRTQDKAVLTLMIASFVGLFGYQVFSVAYYFFREIRVGLFPWVLMGVAIGVYERYKISMNRKIIEGDSHDGKN